MSKFIGHLKTPYWGILGLVLLAGAMAYSFSPISPQRKFPLPTGIAYLTLNNHLPIWIYSLIWAVAGIITLALLVQRRSGFIGVAIITALSALFGWFYVIGWAVDTFVSHIPSRSYLFGFVLIAFSVYMAGNLPGETVSKDSSPNLEGHSS